MEDLCEAVQKNRFNGVDNLQNIICKYNVYISSFTHWSILAYFGFKSIASLIEGEGMIYQEISNVKCNLIAGRPKDPVFKHKDEWKGIINIGAG